MRKPQFLCLAELARRQNRNKSERQQFLTETYESAKVHKKSDFLRPVYKKVKTVTIFVGKKRSAGFPSLIER